MRPTYHTLNRLGTRSAPALVPDPMRNEKIFLEKVLGKVIEFLVFGPEPVGGRDAGDTCEFVHVLRK